MGARRPVTERPPLDYDELFPGRFIKAGQLGDKRPTLTIERVDVETLPDEKQGERRRGVLVFREMPYHLIVNSTNGQLLRSLFGRNLPAWIGRKITLYRGAVESGSQKGEPAVRIWGSPELERDRTVEVKLPRKKPMHLTLHAVRAKDASAPPAVDKHPTEGKAPAP
jgi:hypothetical protein